MKIDLTTSEDGYAVLTLKGEFDSFHCPRFQKEIEHLIDLGICHVLLDMRLVKMINSTALGAIVKAHKRCRAEGGELVISRPSPFVKKVVQQVGIDRVVPTYDDEHEAVRRLVQSLNALELAGDAPVQEEKILITFPDDTRPKQVGRRTVVGTMSNVDGQRVQFTWSGKKFGLTGDQARQLFFPSSELALKFQVRLCKKGYFQVRAKVDEVQDADENAIRVTASYTQIHEADREALAQFAADIEFLKRQLPD